jgi:hypothetical protein
MEDGRTILDKSLQYWSVDEVDALGVGKHVREELTSAVLGEGHRKDRRVHWRA